MGALWNSTAGGASPQLALTLHYGPDVDFEFVVLKHRLLALRRFLARDALGAAERADPPEAAEPEVVPET